MNKKPYSPPKVTKVMLEVKQAILGTCNTTTGTDPQGMGSEPCWSTGCAHAVPPVVR